MKKTIKNTFFISLLFVLTSFGYHKFYISIYQIEYSKEKKMVQITSRIFIDDMNKALENKYGKKTNLCDKNETKQDVDLMNKYITENFSIKINGKPKPYTFISKESENNVIIGYYKITSISSIKSIEVQNTVLMDLYSDQQNIIQSKIEGKKESLLLTIDNVKGKLK
jgi:hypothetical protein